MERILGYPKDRAGISQPWLAPAASLPRQSRVSTRSEHAAVCRLLRDVSFSLLRPYLSDALATSALYDPPLRRPRAQSRTIADASQSVDCNNETRTTAPRTSATVAADSGRLAAYR